MPLIELQRIDFDLMAAETNYMDLTGGAYDGQAYVYEWRGEGGILPYYVFANILNRNIVGRELRFVRVAPNHPTPPFPFWDADEDKSFIFTKILGTRSGFGLPIQHTVYSLGLANTYDTVAFRIRPKAQAYSITVQISPITDDIGSSEYRFPST